MISASIIQNKSVVGEGQDFQRIRRITGYLVGDLSRFNNAKSHEVKERVKHQFTQYNNNVYLGGKEISKVM